MRRPEDEHDDPFLVERVTMVVQPRPLPLRQGYDEEEGPRLAARAGVAARRPAFIVRAGDSRLSAAGAACRPGHLREGATHARAPERLRDGDRGPGAPGRRPRREDRRIFGSGPWSRPPNRSRKAPGGSARGEHRDERANRWQTGLPGERAEERKQVRLEERGRLRKKNAAEPAGPSWNRSCATRGGSWSCARRASSTSCWEKHWRGSPRPLCIGRSSKTEGRPRWGWCAH
jgi:hypothetical protein